MAGAGAAVGGDEHGVVVAAGRRGEHGCRAPLPRRRVVATVCCLHAPAALAAAAAHAAQPPAAAANAPPQHVLNAARKELVLPPGPLSVAACWARKKRAPC